MEKWFGIVASVLVLASFTACAAPRDNDCMSNANCPEGAYCYVEVRACFMCPAGKHPEGEACVEDTVQACGFKALVCLAPPSGHGQPVCLEGACGYDCDAGYEKEATGCFIAKIPCSSANPCTGGLVCNEKWGFCAASDCAGKPDFTRCNLVTSPDFSYDICAGGVCVSPGTCDDRSCNTPGPHFKLADTNQRKCYDNSYEAGIDNGEIECPNSGKFSGQDAQYGWDTIYTEKQRFRKDENAVDAVIVDNVTGLMWQASAETGKTWLEALEYCEALPLHGYGDWRLPDPYELDSILDLGRYAPAIDSEDLFVDVADRVFWTSASHLGKQVWYVDLDEGTLSYYRSNTESHSVRCVRSEPMDLPGQRFVRSGDNEPVVEDRVTGLVWQGCAVGIIGYECDTPIEVPACTTPTEWGCRWGEALVYCEELVWAGQNDWRLPNAKELLSIDDFRVEGSTTIPTIRGDVFPNAPASEFWSSSSYSKEPITAWVINFGSGYRQIVLKDDHRNNRVRCVRDGP